MIKTRLWLSLVAALIVTALPTVAAAQPSAVYDTLKGTALDPAATTVRVVPPRGGTVMVYQRGKVVGWWMRAGIAAVTPNQAYGVLATRGSQMLFNAQVMMRPGNTELIWSDSDLPQVAYYPALGYRQPTQRASAPRRNQAGSAVRRSATVGRSASVRRSTATTTTSYPLASSPRNSSAQPSTRSAAPSQTARSEQQRNAARVATRAAITNADYQRMLRAMDYADGDRARLTVVRSFARRYRFSAAQRSAVLGRFDSTTLRDSAAQLLISRSGDGSAPTKLRSDVLRKVASR